ncbi:hypothetical protein DZG03_06280, partial [Clavibacter phaseoli]
MTRPAPRLRRARRWDDRRMAENTDTASETAPADIAADPAAPLATTETAAPAVAAPAGTPAPGSGDA